MARQRATALRIGTALALAALLAAAVGAAADVASWERVWAGGASMAALALAITAVVQRRRARALRDRAEGVPGGVAEGRPTATSGAPDRGSTDAGYLRSEAFLAEGQRISQTGTWGWTRATREIAWSDENYRIFEADPSIPRPWPGPALEALWWGRLHPDDRERVTQSFVAAMGRSAALAVEYRLLMADGSVKHLRSEGRPSEGHLGVDYIGTTMDVTRTRLAEARLRRSEAYLAEGQRLSATGSWAWQIDSGERYWSREMFRIYGFEPAERPPAYAEILGRAHPEDAPGVDAALTRAFRDGTELRLLTRIRVPDAPMKWVQTYGHPVRDERGNVVEFIGTVVDVTARIRAERRLRRAIAGRYAAVLAERTRIARDMHDGLLQDLTGMTLQLRAVLACLETASDAALRLREVLTLAEQAGRAARVAVQGMRGRPESVDLVSAVHHAASRVTAPTALALTVRVAGRPRLVSRLLRDAAVSIVTEALTNVAKHADARAVRVAVSFASRRCRLSVRDDGQGAVAVGNRDGEDNGHFGLVGMRERAAGVGGSFSFRSDPGRGTLVRLEVPYTR